MNARTHVLVEPWLNPLLRQDAALVRRVARWRPPQWVRLWMVCASRGGDGGLWWAAGAGVLAYGGQGRLTAFGAAAVAAMGAVGCFIALKKLARRQRPNRLQAHAWARLTARDEFSFPSGHSLTAFAVATALASPYPEFGCALLFCAFSVALSRVLLGLHFLTDVIAGSALGAMIGLASVHLIAR